MQITAVCMSVFGDYSNAQYGVSRPGHQRFLILFGFQFHVVHRSPVRFDRGLVVLSPRSAYYAVCGRVLWLWLHCLDASSSVCIHPSVQLWWAYVAHGFQQVRLSYLVDIMHNLSNVNLRSIGLWKLIYTTP